VKAEDLRYFEELLGSWEIRYPGDDGMINESYAERLDLRSDGTYSWSPTPLWARPGSGRWGVAGDPATRELKLYFEGRRGALRGQWLVYMTLRAGERTERLIHWQRTQYGAVVFSDRILTGRWLGAAKRTETPASGRVGRNLAAAIPAVTEFEPNIDGKSVEP
jgi:hypothetical protein